MISPFSSPYTSDLSGKNVPSAQSIYSEYYNRISPKEYFDNLVIKNLQEFFDLTRYGFYEDPDITLVKSVIEDLNIEITWFTVACYRMRILKDMTQRETFEYRMTSRLTALANGRRIDNTPDEEDSEDEEEEDDLDSEVSMSDDEEDDLDSEVSMSDDDEEDMNESVIRMNHDCIGLYNRSCITAQGA